MQSIRSFFHSNIKGIPVAAALPEDAGRSLRMHRDSNSDHEQKPYQLRLRKITCYSMTVTFPYHPQMCLINHSLFLYHQQLQLAATL